MIIMIIHYCISIHISLCSILYVHDRNTSKQNKSEKINSYTDQCNTTLSIMLSNMKKKTIYDEVDVEDEDFDDEDERIYMVIFHSPSI